MTKYKITPRETVARALKDAMRASPDLKTQNALAKRAGVGQTTVGRILRGEVDAQSDNLRRLATALRISVAELYGEPGSAIKETTGPVSSRGGNVSAHRDGAARVPLISRPQMRALVEEKIEHDRIEAEEWLLAPRRCSARTFALRVEGAAMEPRFSHGDVIFVDPEVKPTPGRLVIVLTDTDTLFRELAVEGARRYLRVLNPEWPGPSITPLESTATICGVVIGKWVDV